MKKFNVICLSALFSLSASFPGFAAAETEKAKIDIPPELIAGAVLALLLVALVIDLLTKKKRTWKKRPVKILFIGNSHTYFNEMPYMVKNLARKKKRTAEVTMLAHPGRYLKEHLNDEGKEAEFNISHGDYEYVVLQEHTHPFEEEKEYLESVSRFCDMIRANYAVPVIYATWAKQDDDDAELGIEALCERAAKENGALLAPVGAEWWKEYRKKRNGDLYFKDGKHASEKGSKLAAEIIWDVIAADSLTEESYLRYKRDAKAKKKDKR